MGGGGKGKGSGWIPQWMPDAAKDWRDERERRKEDDLRKRARDDMEKMLDERLGRGVSTTASASTTAAKAEVPPIPLRQLVKEEARRLMFKPSDTSDDPLPPKLSQREVRDMVKAEYAKMSKNEDHKSKKKKSKKDDSDSDNTSDMIYVKKEKMASKKRNKNLSSSSKSKPDSENSDGSRTRKLVLPICQRKDEDGLREDIRWNVTEALGVSEDVPIEAESDQAWDDLLLRHKRVTTGALKELCKALGGPTSGAKPDMLKWIKDFTKERI
eukprot:TRINITY_DN26239_c0_g1_i2.p1 TRINITY_DN26239_c0_g1~~TRINITY_DN26239_c0_g1_i2.p1  ORF type:complete len:270 (+),score=68.73 TRINITY_DN26239_c0_g1_i2:927-1736(+)